MTARLWRRLLSVTARSANDLSGVKREGEACFIKNRYGGFAAGGCDLRSDCAKLGGSASFERPSGLRLVDANHDIRRLDHRVGGLTSLELQFVDGLIGDRRRDDRAADVDADMGRGPTLLHLVDRSLQHVSSAQFHLVLYGLIEFKASHRRTIALYTQTT